MEFGSRVGVLTLLLVVCSVSVGVKARFIEQPKDLKPESIDELLRKAANLSRNDQVQYDSPNGFVRTEYDIIMSREEYNQRNSPGREKRAAGLVDRSGRWTNNVVNYEYIQYFWWSDKNEIQAAFNDLTSKTCLTFRETSSARNRIQIISDNGCYSYVGMAGGTQPLSLGYGCRHKHIVIHELLHALGVHHEQTRPDRDQHVKIRKENIDSNMIYNFEINRPGTIITAGIPYDYYSIMHYGKTAFSNNGQITIQTLNPAMQDVIGSATELTFYDLKTVNTMYNCHYSSPASSGSMSDKAWCTKTEKDCPAGTFVGKDCTCWCPGNPVKHCDPQDDLIHGHL